MSIKQTILDVVSDAVMDLMYYDRKEDEILPRGRIEEALKAGDITIDEMVKCFERELKANM